MVTIAVFLCFNLVFQSDFSQTQTTAEADPEIRACGNEGDVHYDDQNFINRPRAAAGDQQEETVYSQINFSKPEQSSALSAVGSEDVYAQVQKH